jgi:hypothetical protein
LRTYFEVLGKLVERTGRSEAAVVGVYFDDSVLKTNQTEIFPLVVHIWLVLTVLDQILNLFQLFAWYQEKKFNKI